MIWTTLPGSTSSSSSRGDSLTSSRRTGEKTLQIRKTNLKSLQGFLEYLKKGEKNIFKDFQNDAKASNKIPKIYARKPSF